ncbi:hypothetical protein DPEC_G00123230 [Dallia pectoralis]|uniref:Uncharacterized protein n=1 Tax=Dallia pectoralis TaxID=75939 RepID=A0ACC2GQE9_DALPE|nr:hypothetical protein DPEC_G00123230 [Dallia pectoralis]
MEPCLKRGRQRKSNSVGKHTSSGIPALQRAADTTVTATADLDALFIQVSPLSWRFPVVVCAVHFVPDSNYEGEPPPPPQTVSYNVPTSPCVRRSTSAVLLVLTTERKEPHGEDLWRNCTTEIKEEKREA